MNQAFPGTEDERTVEDVDRHIKEANAELPPLLTDERIEDLALVHEAFGFGRVDKRGLTTHGFDPSGLRDFARAVEAEVRTAIAAAGGGVPQRESLVAAFLSAMEWGRDHWASFSVRGQDQREIAEQFADNALASSPQPEAAQTWHDTAAGAHFKQAHGYGVQPEAAPAVAKVPQGWKLVPVEPTQEMVNAGRAAMRNGGLGVVTTTYESMLASSPQPEAAPAVAQVPREALMEARDMLESWTSYVPPYFAQKHGLSDDFAKLDAWIAAAPEAPAQAANGERRCEYNEGVCTRADCKETCQAEVLRHEARAALAAQSAEEVERLPEDATPSMVEAAYLCTGVEPHRLIRAWKAMRAALSHKEQP